MSKFESGYIEIAENKLVDLVKSAYDLSVPVGLGFLHYKPESLTDEEAKGLITEIDARCPVRMDYINGRCVKMTVFRDKDTGKLYIHDKWFDHSDKDLSELLDRIGS